MQDERHISFKAILDNIPPACDFVAEGAETAGLDERAVYHCQLAVDEACTNIIQYGVAKDDESVPNIDVTTGIDGAHTFIIIITDPTNEFNPLDHEDPDPKAKLKDRESAGGWGIYFIKKLMDAVDYRHDNGKNRLTLHKIIPREVRNGKHDSTQIYVASKAREKNYWQIDLAGRLDSNNSSTLEEILNEALEQGHYRLIVNLDGVDYISSSGLKALVTAWRLARDNGGDVLLTNLRNRIKEIFNMIGFDMMFNIYDSPSDAIDADPLGS